VIKKEQCVFLFLYRALVAYVFHRVPLQINVKLLSAIKTLKENLCAPALLLYATIMMIALLILVTNPQENVSLPRLTPQNATTANLTLIAVLGENLLILLLLVKNLSAIKKENATHELLATTKNADKDNVSIVLLLLLAIK
jgi:hypothetical protein